MVVKCDGDFMSVMVNREQTTCGFYKAASNMLGLAGSLPASNTKPITACRVYKPGAPAHESAKGSGINASPTVPITAHLLGRLSSPGRLIACMLQMCTQPRRVHAPSLLLLLHDVAHVHGASVITSMWPLLSRSCVLMLHHLPAILQLAFLLVPSRAWLCI